MANVVVTNNLLIVTPDSSITGILTGVTLYSYKLNGIELNTGNTPIVVTSVTNQNIYYQIISNQIQLVFKPAAFNLTDFNSTTNGVLYIQPTWTAASTSYNDYGNLFLNNTLTKDVVQYTNFLVNQLKNIDDTSKDKAWVVVCFEALRQASNISTADYQSMVDLYNYILNIIYNQNKNY